MDQVQEIKKKVDIASLMSEYLPLKKAGRRFKANCPFHQEKTPSFVVSPELQIYKCFGCGASGDIFTFLQEYEKLTFPEALEVLAQRAGVKLKKSYRRPEDIKKARLLEINQRAIRFYHHCLTKHKVGQEALSYLHDRGIKDETIKHFKLGYAPKRDTTFPTYLIKKLSYHPQELVASGIFLKSSYQKDGLFDRFANRLIFPINNHRGQTIAFSGRLLPTDQRKNTGKYINSPETPLYHKSNSVYGLDLAKQFIKENDQIIVTEGELDMISPYQAGIKNIIAIKGTAFTEGQLELLGRFSKNLLLALDADVAGAEATKKSILLADSMSFDMKVLVLKKYKDPDEAVQKDLPYFKSQLKKAIPVWDFFLNTALSTNSAQTIYGKKKILSQTLPYFARLENQVEKDVYFSRLAASLGVSKEAIEKEAQKQFSKNNPSSRPPTPPPPRVVSTPQTRREILEEYLLHLLLRSKKPQLILEKDQKLEKVFKIPKYVPFIKKLKGLKKFDPSSFVDSFPAEIKPSFEKAYLKGLELELDSKTRFKEMGKTKDAIRSIDLKREINQLSQSLAQSESQKKKKGLKKIEQKILDLTRELSQIKSQT